MWSVLKGKQLKLSSSLALTIIIIHHSSLSFIIIDHSLIHRFKQTYDLFTNPYLQSIMSEIEEGPLATIRLACLLYPFKYQFVCGEMQVISKKKQEMVPMVLSPLVKHFVRESLKV